MIDERAFEHYEEDYFYRAKQSALCGIHKRFYPMNDDCPVCMEGSPAKKLEYWSCGNCGHQNEPEYNRCPMCGWHQDWGRGRWWMKKILGEV